MESTMSTPKKGLGRGLSALIPAAEPTAEPRGASSTLEVAAIGLPEPVPAAAHFR